MTCLYSGDFQFYRAETPCMRGGGREGGEPNSYCKVEPQGGHVGYSLRGHGVVNHQWQTSTLSSFDTPEKISCDYMIIIMI